MQWIFQANPNRYRILDSLQMEKEELWNLNQHAGEIQSGDDVFIWVAGESAGIYAVGTVRSEPSMTSDTPVGQGYWIDPHDGARPKPRVLVRYSRKLVSRPLLRAYIQNDPDLKNLSILRFPRGTNFPVTDEEYQAILRWLDQIR